jgi:mono/diheme cytochrome c family protein
VGSWELGVGIKGRMMYVEVPRVATGRVPCFGLRAVFVLAALCLAGCHSDMYDQPRNEPLEKSTFFEDQRASRPLVAGTVPRGALQEDEVFSTGKRDGQFVDELPIKVDLALLQRGQERFNIFCTPCHGLAGYGDGIIVQRGYRQPPSYHIDRLRGAPIGHFFDVMTHGFGVMPPYARQVPTRDRWAIAAYIRALQWSQYAKPGDLNPESRKLLEDPGN